MKHREAAVVEVEGGSRVGKARVKGEGMQARRGGRTAGVGKEGEGDTCRRRIGTTDPRK